MRNGGASGGFSGSGSNGSSGGGFSGGGLSEAERARLTALDIQQKRLTRLIGILERFNGLCFVTLNDDTLVINDRGQRSGKAVPMPSSYQSSSSSSGGGSGGSSGGGSSGLVFLFLLLIH